MPESVHYWCLGNNSKGCHLAEFKHTNIVGFISNFPSKLDKKCQAFPLKKMKMTSIEYSQERLVGVWMLELCLIFDSCTYFSFMISIIVTHGDD